LKNVVSKCTQYSNSGEVLVLTNEWFERVVVPDGKGVISA